MWKILPCLCSQYYWPWWFWYHPLNAVRPAAAAATTSLMLKCFRIKNTNFTQTQVCCCGFSLWEGRGGEGVAMYFLSLVNLLGSAQQLCKMFEIWPLSIYYTVGYHQNLLLLLREFCSQNVAGWLFCASPTRSHKMDFSEIMTVWIDGFEQPVFTCISSISQSINQ